MNLPAKLLRPLGMAVAAATLAACATTEPEGPPEIPDAFQPTQAPEPAQ